MLKKRKIYFVIAFVIFTIITIYFTKNLIFQQEFNPKPPTYLKVNLPMHHYHNEMVACFLNVSSADIFTLKKVSTDYLGQCAQEIDLGPINGTLYLYYKGFNTRDSLGTLINLSNDMVDDHKIKADKIDFEQIIDRKRKVYGTFFTFKGNVATNFQFYLTDSVSHFVRAEVLLNCRPNYDSLRPTLDYLKIDLLKFVNTLEWKKN